MVPIITKSPTMERPKLTVQDSHIPPHPFNIHPSAHSKPSIIRTCRKHTRILVRRDLLDSDRLAVFDGAGLVLEQLRDPVAAPVVDDDLLVGAHPLDVTM